MGDGLRPAECFAAHKHWLQLSEAVGRHMLGGARAEGRHMRGRHMRGGNKGGHGGTQDMQPVCPSFHAPVYPSCVHEGGSAVAWERWGNTP